MSQHGARDDVLRIERIFAAPVALVWQLWTDPEHFKGWYGPEGATIPTAVMDVRVGGLRRICMELRTPDGLIQMCAKRYSWGIAGARESSVIRSPA